jgi:cbb3-type cytochrome oxidase maturation protein
MEVLFVVVPLAIAFAGVAVIGYVWAVKAGQFDDLTTPAHQMLIDDAVDVQPTLEPPVASPRRQASSGR